ncbi:MAG: hypothetical protein DRJ38_02345 [Thermoprotei archaeon]|nr:MAG: hypothetical protein DRJ38_02345 [Thermoprotei archaeon]
MPTYFIGFLAPLKKFDMFIEDPYEPIPLNQRHLTLVYLGYLRNSEKRNLLYRIREGLEVETVRAVFDSLGVFPSARKPRYLAALPKPKDADKLLFLRKKLEEFFREYLKDKYREFKPHVSIAYTRSKADLELREKAAKIVRRCRGVKEILMLDKLYLFQAEKGLISPISVINMRSN